MFISSSSFHVLYTKDVEKTFTFYESLGAVIKQHQVDKVVVSLETFDLHFILNTSEPFDAYKYIADDEHYGQGIIFYIGTTTIEDDFQKIKNAGGTLKTEIFENHWNAREFLFEDPNGYKVAVYQE